MRLCNLRVCNLEKPVGFAMEAPVFSWTVEDAAGGPAWASLAINVGGKTVYQSGEIPEADSLGWRLDLPLEPRTRHDYTLTVRSTAGDQTSADAFFETGKRNEAWQAQWISPRASRSAALLKKRFRADGTNSPSRLYICGLGVYEAYLNGEKVGDEYLAPGYHAYDFHLAAQTYDVTALLREGDNELVIALGEGWFKDRLGFEGGYTNLYGDRLPQLDILSQASVFITHAGMGGTGEAIYYGVPMIAIPQMDEQAITAGQIEKNGLGVAFLDKSAITSEALKAEIVKLLKEPSYSNTAKAFSEDMRSLGGAQASADAIIHFLEKK